MISSQERWNQRYDGIDSSQNPRVSGVVAESQELLPKAGTALDLAGGVGDTALWLAQQGLSTTLVDVSDVGLAVAERRAEQLGLALQTMHVDLETEPAPAGPWDLITCSHYLNRPLLHQLASLLSVGGVAAVGIATTTNLERHDRPSARFLLEPQELPTLLEGLTIVRHVEDWAPWDVHEARVVAVRER
jgi:2-polyprenyl-3-methyl-5-hydroxy-6-metoxy-1,4-benzoquinol methylase